MHAPQFACVLGGGDQPLTQTEPPGEPAVEGIQPVPDLDIVQQRHGGPPGDGGVPGREALETHSTR